MTKDLLINNCEVLKDLLFNHLQDHSKHLFICPTFAMMSIDDLLG